MKNIAKAIIDTMAEIKGIEKDATVGSGSYSYKGVSDKEVKIVVGRAMQKHGLCIIPTDIISTVKVERWQDGNRQKQQVFNDVITKYMLLHTSGESIEVTGSGHGIDSQDKAAGKATTYALKYALLYLFLIPTGSIDDSDAEHSDDKPIPRTLPMPPKDAIELTDLQFETSKKATRQQIINVLGTFKMKKAYREELEKLVK